MSEYELRDGIAGPGIDVVDLILPHFLHYEAATKALNAGKTGTAFPQGEAAA